MFLIKETVASCRLLHPVAQFNKDVRDYKGYAFLNSREEKETGEVGPQQANSMGGNYGV